MGYDKELYFKLDREYETLRREAAADVQRRQEAVFARVPELREVDGALKQLGLKISRLILGGGSSAEALSRLREEQKTLRVRRKMLLLENGYPEDELALRYQCPDCRDTGAIGTHPCACYNRRLVELAYQSSNLSGLLKQQEFAQFDLSLYPDEPAPGYAISPRQNMREIYQICKRFADRFDRADRGLLFTGRPGVGKTFLSTCIARVVIQQGYSVIYETAYRIFSLLDEYKFKKSADAELLKVQIERLYDCDLLIIDDLGAEFKTTYTSAALFDVLNTRMIAGKKCIINTNLTLEELKQEYSERVISRIIGNYDILLFLGQDLRQRNIPS